MAKKKREVAMKTYEEWIETLKYFIALPSMFVEAEKAELTIDSASLQPVFGQNLRKLLEKKSGEFRSRVAGSTGVSLSRILAIAKGVEMDEDEILKLANICWIIAFSCLPSRES